MHNFHKKPIVLAVGAALATVAGGALAAATQHMSVRTTGAMLTSKPNVALTETEKQSLYSAAGVSSSKFSLKLYIKSSDTTTSNIGFGDSGGAAGAGATSAIPLIGDSQGTQGLLDSQNHIVVYGTNGTTAVSLHKYVDANSLAGDTSTRDSTGSSLDSSGVSVTVTPGSYTLAAAITDSSMTTDGARFRVDSASGKILFSNDSGATWLNVKVRMPGIDGAAADSKGFFTDTDPATDSVHNSNDSSTLFKTFDSTDVFAGHTLLPQPTLSTYADSTGLVSGVVMEAYGTALGTVAATNLRIFAVKPSGATETTWNDSGDSTTNITANTPTTSGSKVTITFTGSTANWTTDTNSSVDAAMYGSKYFNTGIKGRGATSTVPFRVNLLGGQAVAYGAAFSETTGSTAYLMKFGTADSVASRGVTLLDSNDTITDGAAPVVLSTNYAKASKTLVVNFSEPIAAISTDTTDYDEAFVNMLVGTTSPGTTLAAINFNNSTVFNNGGSSVANASGVGTLTIAGVGDSTSGLADTTAGNKLFIAKRISLGEPGDAGYALNDSITSVLDTSGFKSVNNEVLKDNAGTMITTAATTLAFDQESSAKALMKASSTTDVEKITIRFPYKLSFDSTAVIKDHFSLTVFDSNAVAPTPFTQFLDSTSVTLDSTDVNITFPTNLVVKNLKGLKVDYDTQWGDSKGVLQFTDPGTNTKKVVTGQTINGGATKAIDSSEISLPYYVTANSAPLYTQEVQYTLTGLTGEAKVTSYLAKWLDAFRGGANDTNDTAGGATHKYLGGKVSDPGNKKLTDLELELADSTMYTTLAAELNKDKPGTIKAYIQIAQSNDQVKAGAGKGDTTAGTDWIQAHAKIATDPTMLGKASSIDANKAVDPVYQVTLDPVTGNISGRLNGQINVTLSKKTGKYRGLTFVTSKAELDSQASNAAQVASVVSGGKVNQLVGIDTTPTTQNNLQGGAFLLTVLEEQGKAARLITSADPGAANFVAFEPNLISGKDGRKAVTIATNLVVENTVGTQTNWRLFGVGNLDRTVKNLPLVQKDWGRQFITVDSTTAEPGALWQGGGTAAGTATGDTTLSDLALTMLASKAGVASEGSSGDTLSTINNANTNVAQFAFAWSNDAAAVTNQKIFHLTKAAQKTTVPAGWNLISAPATMPAAGWCASATSLNCVTHMLKVGAGYTTPATWVVGDTGGNPTLTAGEPVFVFVKGLLSLN